MRWKQKNKQGKGEEMEEETNRDQAKNLNVKEEIKQEKKNSIRRE